MSFSIQIIYISYMAIIKSYMYLYFSIVREGYLVMYMVLVLDDNLDSKEQSLLFALFKPFDYIESSHKKEKTY